RPPTGTQVSAFAEPSTVTETTTSPAAGAPVAVAEEVEVVEVVDEGAAEPLAQDRPLSTTGTTAAGTTDAEATTQMPTGGQPHMLSSEEMDDLARDVPLDTDHEGATATGDEDERRA
ncbi:MAG: hypothetical protein Q4G34_12065, partial [Micrococcus sp.]|nr:hypothetical protein [Micrococcus sp.]